MISPAVAYGRVSTDEQAQRGYGLAAQLHELREFATRRGYEIVAELADDGISGSTLDRPSLTKLREGVRAGTFGVVLVHAPDRLSRNLAHQLLLLEEFRKAGAKIEFLTTPAEDSAEGRLLLHVSGVISEFEREKIKERTLRGKREKARRGLVVSPSNAAFGYAPDPVRPGHLMIHEGQAEVVRLIYRLCVDEGKSVRAIVAELRRRGHASARGAWSCRQVRRVLSEPRYTGVAHFNRKRVLPNGKAGERAPEEWITVAVPPIVAVERHTAAQVQLARNRATLVGRPSTLFYMLRRLVTCGTCAGRYRGAASGGRRKYKHGDGACPATFYFTADALEASVRETIAAALRDPEILRRGVEQHEQRRGAEDVELRSRVAHLQKQIAAIRRDERRLIDLAVADGEQQAVVQGKLRELAARRGRLGEQLRDAEAKVAAHAGAPGADAIARVCEEARRGLEHLDAAEWRDLLRHLVHDIRVLGDRSLEIHGIIPQPARSVELGRPSTRSPRRSWTSRCARGA